MTGLLLVVLAVGGSCAYVWSMIVRAEADQHAAGGGQGESAPVPFSLRKALIGTLRRAASVPRLLLTWVLTARARRRRDRIDRALDAGARRPRFEDTAELTVPLSALASVEQEASPSWTGRPSRLVSALELVILILVVGGAVAAVTVGTARVVARIVAAHFAG